LETKPYLIFGFRDQTPTVKYYNFGADCYVPNGNQIFEGETQKTINFLK